MSFRNAAVNANNEAPTRTTNGMKARKTTASAVLDFFGSVGSARGKDMSQSFIRAMTENEDLAIRALLWTRDIRGGAGERGQFRNIILHLEMSHPIVARKVMNRIPEIGRWDDLFAYTDPINRKAAFGMIRDALVAGNALAAKWMPRKGPVAAELRKFLGMSPKQYRKTIVNLTTVVETQMCNKEWGDINFSHVPSVASARYQKAFGRNAAVAYAEYINELQKAPEDRTDPKVKINAGAVYPHDIVKSVKNGNAAAADAQWKALPNFVGDNKILPMVDVSGSMHRAMPNGAPMPIETAIALGLYLSEKNTSSFKDLFLTFSDKPQLVTSTGTLSDRIYQMNNAAWGFNTNIAAAFKLVLETAIKGKVSQDDMPDSILILSDMQFDQSCHRDDSAMEMIERSYDKVGYHMPKIVFWNLASSTSNVPIKFDKQGTALISGFSPAIMKAVLADDMEEYSPYNVMLQALMIERYDY